MSFKAGKYICFVLVSSWVVSAHAQLPARTDEYEKSDGDETKPAEFNSELRVDLFRKLYHERRKEHVKAVEALRKKDYPYEKKYKTIELGFETMFKVFESHDKVVGDVLRKIDKPEKFVFDSIGMRDNVSSVLENIALFGDIALQIPKMTERILRSKKNQLWKDKFLSILDFANRTRFLLDDTTASTIDLVFQELEIVPRSPNYHNPFSSEDNQGREKINKKAKKNKSRRTGPQMARQEL